MPARPPLRTVLESFPSYGSSPSNQYSVIWALGGNSLELPLQYALAAIEPAFGGRSNQWNSTLWAGRKTHQLIAQLSFAFLSSRWFYQFSCKEGPDRRGHIQRITHWPWLLRSSQCCSSNPPYGEVCPVRRPGEVGSVSMFHNSQRMI